MNLHHSVFIKVGCMALLITHVHAAKPLPVAAIKHEAPVDYVGEIHPILKANCISCHNKTTTKGDLNIETRELMLKGGENGPAIVPGHGAKSPLFTSSGHLDDPAMPPKGNKVSAVDLKPEELALLKLWIDQGAKMPARSEKQIVWEPLPEGLKGIYSVALTQDGEYAACGRGGHVFVYHVPTKRLVTRLVDDSLKNNAAHRDLVPSLAFSPDGMMLVSGSYREVKLWSKDGISSRSLAAGEIGADSALLREADKALLAKLKHGAEIVMSAASADGQFVVTVGKDHTIKLWNTGTSALIAELKGERSLTEAASEQARVATFMQGETEYARGLLKTAEDDLKKLQDRVKKVSDDLKKAKEEIAPKEKLRDEAAKAKADEAKALSALNDLANQGPPREADAAKLKEANAKVTAAEKKRADAEADVPRAVAAADHQVLELKLANEAVKKAEFDVNGAKSGVTKAEELQKKAEESAQEATKVATSSQKATRALALSDNGTALATADDGGIIHLWATSTGAALSTLPSKGTPVNRLKSSSGDAWIAIHEDGTGTEWQCAPSWRLAKTLGGSTTSPMNDRVNALRFSPDGKRLASGSGDPSRAGEVVLWEVTSGKVLKAWPDLHKDAVFAVDFSPDGKLIASGSGDKTVKVLDVASGKIERGFEGHASHVLGVAWRHEGRTILSSGAEGAVKVWDYIGGDRKKSIDGWEGEVTSVSYVGYTGNMLTSSADKRVRLLTETGSEVKSFPGAADFLQGSAISADGSIIVAGGIDGVLRVWDGKSAAIIAEFPVP